MPGDNAADTLSSREVEYLRRETETNVAAMERWYARDLERRAELSLIDGLVRCDRRHEEER